MTMALWMLGYPDQAPEGSRRALNLAEEVAQPWSLARPRGTQPSSTSYVETCRPPLEQAEATIQLATEQVLSPGRQALRCPGLLAEQGQGDGLAQIQQGMAIWRASRHELAQPFCSALLAGQYGKAGQVEAGLSLLSEALALARTRELRLWEAELHRLQGSYC